jgi:hypothetical protein
VGKRASSIGPRQCGRRIAVRCTGKSAPRTTKRMQRAGDALPFAQRNACSSISPWDIRLVIEDRVDRVVVLVADLERQPARIEVGSHLPPDLRARAERGERRPWRRPPHEVQDRHVVADQVCDELLARAP